MVWFNNIDKAEGREVRYPAFLCDMTALLKR